MALAITVMTAMAAGPVSATGSADGRAQDAVAATSCPPAQNHVKHLALKPSGGKLPAGGTAALLASGDAASPLTPGMYVRVTVVCGPDKGSTRSVRVTKDARSTAPKMPTAAITVDSTHGPGRDLISVRKVGKDSKPVGPAATAAVTWVRPIPCSESVTKLGYMRTLQCKLKAVAPLLKSAEAGYSCRWSVASFAFPEANLVKVIAVLKDTKDPVTTARVAKAAGVSTTNPVVRLVQVLNKVRHSKEITLAQIQTLLGGGRAGYDLAGFITNFKSLVTNVTSAQYLSTVATDIAALTGVGACVKLISRVTTALAWSNISAGSHTCGIETDDTAWCWGNNWNGELGTITNSGTDRPNPTPVQVRGAWSSITTGDDHTCGIRTNHSAWCWGYNGEGQLGTSTDNTGGPTLIQIAGEWSLITAGGEHTCAIRSNGTAWCWGYNEDGQLGTATNVNTGEPIPTPVQVAGNWSSVSAGMSHTCGVKSDGTAWCWGDDYSGQLGPGAKAYTYANPVPVQIAGAWSSISAGSDDTCGVKTDGTAWCWGDKEAGELGISPDTRDGSPAHPKPVQIAGIWSDVSAGAGSTCGMKADRTVWCWGANDAGQLGTPPNSHNIDAPHPKPVHVSGTWLNITLDDGVACGIKTAGTAWCWGDNSSGELGTPTNAGTNRPNPTPIEVGVH
ncbi:MAG TPA: hypothetical protein VF426_05030 [Marmoricola sp.]